jgi:hypothetical protein
MLRLKSKITINGLVFDFVNQIDISSSWELQTDRAVITLPARFILGGKTIVGGTANNIFKRGDSVKIELGYEPNLVTEFEGYISKIIPDSPLTIECEDLMWLLKQDTVTKSFQSTTLSNLLENTLPEGIQYDAIEAELGQFRIVNVTVAQVLKKLKEVYGLVSWVRNGVLRVGLAAYPADAVESDILFQKNVVSQNLEYLREDDVKVKVKAISIQPDNKKIEVDVGDENGEQRTLTYYNLPEDELRAIAERELPKLKYEGYFGSFLTFGEPSIKHGDHVNLTDKKFPERSGKFLVNSVTKSFGLGGYRQEVDLGIKLDPNE